MRSKGLLVGLLVVVSVLIIGAMLMIQNQKNRPSGVEHPSLVSPAETANPQAKSSIPPAAPTSNMSPLAPASGAPGATLNPGSGTDQKATNQNPDLTTDPSGLSKATVVMDT